MEFGGSDISRLLHWLLTRAGAKLNEMNLTQPHSILQLQEIKEAFCHLDQVICLAPLKLWYYLYYL
jgi:actin-related protein 8